MEIKKIIGFDVSSKCIGWCLLEIHDKDIKFVKCGFISPDKKLSILEKIVKTREEINKILMEYKPDYIGIEDLIKFMPKTTNTTIVTLTIFNRMVALTSYDYLQKFPQLLNVLSIRHGLKENKILPKKEEIPELIERKLNINFPYIKSKKGKIKPETYDMADAVAVALYYAYVLLGLNKKSKVKKK